MISNNIDKHLIRELRRRTSISIIKCKQALIESDGNIELAIDNLRRLGLKMDCNKSNRSTPSGLIHVEITSDQKTGLIIEINCETDFVSKNSIFQEFIKIVAVTALHESIDNIDFLRVRFDKQRLILVSQVGENIRINRLMILRGDRLGSYIHRSKIGVIVSISGNVDNNIIKHFAMHIAAKHPRYIYVSDVPDDVLNRERCVQIDIASKSAKSSKILERIIDGRIEKFVNEIVLTKQAFILDINKTVGKILDEHCIKIDNFIRFEIGEYD